MIKEFKEFIMKGNLLEIAVGLILALAFKSVIDALVSGILTPIVAAIGGQPDFQSLTVDIGDGRIRYGIFLDALVSFVIIGLVLFLVVKAYNRVLLASRRRGQENEVAEPGEDVLLLREIRDSLRSGR